MLLLVHLSELFEQGNDPGDVPSQLRHCMIKVAKKFGGMNRKGARAAWNICRWSLTDKGYLKKPYEKDSGTKSVKMTAKGTRASMRHSNEPDVTDKNNQFKKLWKRSGM